MPPNPPFETPDPLQWPSHGPLRIIVHPYRPPTPSSNDRPDSDGGIDDWIVPGKLHDDGYPDDWIVPSRSGTVDTGQGAQYSPSGASNTGLANPPAAPFGNTQIGAAWLPPNLPTVGPSFSSDIPSVSGWPSAPPLLPGKWPTSGADALSVPAWLAEQSLLGRIADLQNPLAAAVRNQSLLGKLFPYPPGAPEPTQPSSSSEGGFFPVPAAAPAASKPMPDVLHALFQGLGSGSRQLAQTGQSFVGRPTIAADDSPAAEPIGWSDLKSPLDRFAPKVAYRFAQSYPTMTGGVVGGVVGGRIGAFAGPYGLAAGAIVGGSLGAAALSAAQTLGPAFAAELQKNPNDPEGAWKRAWRQAEISGAFSGASWAVFPARFFQGPVKQLLFQTFAVQPAISVAERTTRNVVEGKPATEGLGEAYGEGVVGTLTPAVGQKGVNRIPSPYDARTGAGGRQPLAASSAGPRSTEVAREPPTATRSVGVEKSPAGTPLREGSFSISDWSGYPDYLPRPKGPFRLIAGEEYEASRTAADRINHKLRRTDPIAHQGKHVHEIQPVKFGGSPIDPTNKILLSPQKHRAANSWWDRLKWNLLRDQAKWS
jgi:hypothetical protein